MAESEHATSVGQTGGLPGDNADPATRYLTDDDWASDKPPETAYPSTTSDAVTDDLARNSGASAGDDSSSDSSGAFDEDDTADPDFADEHADFSENPSPS